MHRPFWVLALWALLGTCAGLRAADDAPAADVPELQVLQHYHGVWDVKVQGDQVQGGESTARWVLGGRFLEQIGVVRLENGTQLHVTTFYTWDVPRKSYRSWTLTSAGTVTEAEMRWDAERKTMTSTTQAGENGIRTTVTADFAQPGKERWQFVFTNRDGQQVGEMRGENTRRVEGATKANP